MFSKVKSNQIDRELIATKCIASVAKGQFPCQIIECRERNNTIDKSALPVAAHSTSNNLQVSQDIIESPPESLSDITKKTLEIIEQVNNGYSQPAVIIVGSLSRRLQGHCSTSRDIDLICSTREVAEILIRKFDIATEESSAELSMQMTASHIPGCESLKLPPMISVNWTESALCKSVQSCQINIDHCIRPKSAMPVTFDGDKTVYCLPLEEETRLLIENLEHLNDNFSVLVKQLGQGAIDVIVRTLLFNYPKTINEKIYGLFMRCLLTISVGRKFQRLQIKEKQNQKIEKLTVNILNRIKESAHFNEFINSVNEWMRNVPEKEPFNSNRLLKVEELLRLFGDSAQRM